MTRSPSAGEQAELVDRLRSALSDQPECREVAMFGGHAFMVNDAILVSAGSKGDLLVRVPPDKAGELTALPGAAVAEMGGRAMGPAWITVAHSALGDPDSLQSWLAIALAENRRQL